MPLLLLCTLGYAQDSQFTQFYAAPTYLNPAFAGTGVQNRINVNSRYQWPGIPGGFQTYSFSFDKYAPQISSGFGIQAFHERAGSGALRSTQISLQYSYEIRIKRDLFFLPALQFSYAIRNINFSELTFGDQLIRDNAETTLEASNFDPVNFFDLGTGFLLFSKKFWLGASIHHLNEPNESLFPQVVSLLPRKYSVHGGYRWRMKGRAYSRSQNYLV
ncbi:MAG: PorP/SprF family type IX secretion system membrane protein [Flavobacteriales bacterium]|nr:PorP/SprF family type IX secretion system membrane protein [Flavobacteriales bacterium]